jgi:ankyrin repeat protein
MLLLNKADASLLDAKCHRCSLYWLYWYNSTNADADVSLLDANGRSALWFAESHGHEEVVKALVQAGAT